MSKPKPIYHDSFSNLSLLVEREEKATVPLSNPSATKSTSKDTTTENADDKAKARVTKLLASISGPNAANRPYGTGDTIASTGVAYKTIGQFNITDGKGQVGGETTFLEARARTYSTKTGVGAEAQAGLVRVEYGAKWDSALAQTGGHELFGAGGSIKGEVFVGGQVNAQAGAGMKGIMPTAQAGVAAFAGARVVITGGGEVRVLGLGLRANGSAQAWAGAQGSASVSASPVGLSAEVEGFAGAAASAEGTASFAGIGVRGEADAYAGAGGKAGITIGYKDGEITVDAALGGALGVGAGGEVGVSVNLDQLVGDAEAFAGVAGELWNQGSQAAGGFLAGVGQAAAGVTGATGDFVEDTVQAAEQAATDAGNAVSEVANDAGQAAGDAVDAVADFFGF